jgi:hypothetical protein
MPKACGIYYFEIQVLNRGQKGYVVVAFESHETNSFLFDAICFLLDF